MKRLLMFIHLVLLLCCAFGCQQDSQSAREDAATALLKSDRAWARTTTAEDFMSFLAEDAIYMNADWGAMEGKNKYGPWLDQVFSRTDLVLDWDPARVGVGQSADMGYTAGDWRATWTDGEGKSVGVSGSYMGVWKRQDDGEWKVVAQMEFRGNSLFQQQETSAE